MASITDLFRRRDDETPEAGQITSAPGMPGAEPEDETFTPAMQGAGLTQAAKPIGSKEIAKATTILTEYKAGKANLEKRIIDDEKWWELRHWEAIKGKSPLRMPEPGKAPTPEPTSAWLFNAIINKHADAMDNYPVPAVLPRERGDEESAKTLSEILPVVMECNDFEQTYSNAWWEKLKHGTAAYGVFWNSRKENGLGDIDIRMIDLLKIFWEPGITDIQESRNLFICELVDTDILDMQYPEHKGRMSGNTVDVAQYEYDDSVDVSKKSVVVDWYYKKPQPNGQTVLHYVKFVGNELLFASENEPGYENGWYEDGRYPIVLDSMFPEKGTPIGFGYISVCKDPQIYIDKLGANILESSMMATKKRFFMSASTNVNEEEFNDWNKSIVHVEGTLDDTRIREITVHDLSSVYLNVLQLKQDEMKETVSNRDITSGGTTAGVTSAAGISALQESGNKVSRDMISASYRAVKEIYSLCIERMRQFYDEMRSFRITGKPTQQMQQAMMQYMQSLNAMQAGVPADQVPTMAEPEQNQYNFVDFSNKGIKPQSIGMGMNGEELYRKPVFDLKISAQKKNPFSRMEENERAKELYSLGFFNPEQAQPALSALDMMNFEGIEKVRETIANGQTLYNVVQQQAQQLAQMAAILSGGQMAPTAGAAPQVRAPQGSAADVDGSTPDQGSVASGVMEASTPMTSYGQRLAQRSSPDMNMGSRKDLAK